MKNIIRIIAACLAIINASFAYNQPQPEIDVVAKADFPTFCATRTVTLKSSTFVLLELNQRLVSDELKEGATVKFIVRADVKAEGRVVIKTGALAVGRVTYIKTASFNDKPEIGIEVRQVKAVDGQMVDVDGNLAVLVGEYTNEGTTKMAGQALTAQVLNDMDIEAER